MIQYTIWYVFPFDTNVNPCIRLVQILSTDIKISSKNLGVISGQINNWYNENLDSSYLFYY
jgi:hypothetical protein